MFDGRTFESEHDEARLAGQLERVKTLMSDGRWRTIDTIARLVHGSAQGISARLRDLRKAPHGAYVVERRRVSGGLFEYRVLPPVPTGQAELFRAPTHMPERVR